MQRKTAKMISSVHPEMRIFVRDQGIRKKLPQACKRYSEDNFLNTTRRSGKKTIPGWTLSILIVLVLAVALLPSFAMAGGNKAKLPVKEVGQLYQYLSKTNPYTGWQLWPGTHKMFPGKRPHGAFLTVYVNDIALKSLNAGEKKFPQGSIIVKENYSAAKKLFAITAMYRVKGYNPMGGDWYWLRYTPEGKIEAQGKVTSCIGCHSAMITLDWVFTKKP